MQLATVFNGQARCRTVVFRGFLTENEILIFTDRNSNKIQELTLNASAEICWYFPISREQYRIRGQISISDDSELIKKSWKSLSENAKKGFAQENLPLDDIVADSFCVLVFRPKYAELLDLFKLNSDPLILEL